MYKNSPEGWVDGCSEATHPSMKMLSGAVISTAGKRGTNRLLGATYIRRGRLFVRGSARQRLRQLSTPRFNCQMPPILYWGVGGLGECDLEGSAVSMPVTPDSPYLEQLQ